MGEDRAIYCRKSFENYPKLVKQKDIKSSFLLFYNGTKIHRTSKTIKPDSN